MSGRLKSSSASISKLMNKNTYKSKYNSRLPKMPLKTFGGNFDGREIYFRFGGFFGGTTGAGGVFSGIISAKFDAMIFSYDYQLGTVAD